MVERKAREQFSLKLSKDVSKAVRQISERRHVPIKLVLERLATDAEKALRRECETLYQALKVEAPAEVALFPATTPDH